MKPLKVSTHYANNSANLRAREVMKNKTYCSFQNTKSVTLFVKQQNLSPIIKYSSSAVIKLNISWKQRTSKDKEKFKSTSITAAAQFNEMYHIKCATPAH